MDLDIFKADKELASFGGANLAANMKTAELIIADLENDFRVFNHSNSQFVWNNFILNHKGDLRNIRQIVAEISRKRDALIESKYKHLEKMAMADVWREKMEAGTSQAMKKVYEIKIEKTEALAALALAPIEGALKDIVTLHEKYREISKELEGCNEKDFEAAEISYWLKRCLSQCLRDLRQFGTISKGEQEPLENMGLNVSRVTEELKTYLVKVESPSETGSPLEIFLDGCVKKYSEKIKDNMKIIESSCFKVE